jgi:hypothetical protein
MNRGPLPNNVLDRTPKQRTLSAQDLTRATATLRIGRNSYGIQEQTPLCCFAGGGI